jgi:N-acyl-D-aspartate/D-glutamate deacylase
MGNCGFGIAPTRPEHRDVILRTLENVEGMSFATLKLALGEDWPFVSFPEYLDAIEQRRASVNYCVLLGHTPLRYFTMGTEPALERAATSQELDHMCRLAHEAMDAGAIGFSTSQAPMHSGYQNRPVPSRLADFSELEAFAGVLRDSGRGIFGCAMGQALGPEELKVIARISGGPVTFAAIVTDLGGPGGHRDLLRRVERVQAEGYRVIPQISCLPVSQAFSLRDPFPLAVLPAIVGLEMLDKLFGPVMAAPSTEARIAIYDSERFRRDFRELTSDTDWRTRVWSKVSFLDVPGHQELEQRTIDEVAGESGQEPSDVLLDVALESHLAARFAHGVVNCDDDEVEKLLHHPGTQVGLSDAGAHASELCDARFPSYLLGHWVREKKSLSLEQAVAMLTGRAADLFGITDRGYLREDLAADIVVFDPETVHAGRPYLTSDLPGGAIRLVATATGIELLVVNGVVIREQRGEVPIEGALPGRLLRGGRLG